MNQFTQELKQSRIKANLSQGDVSTKLGYSTPQFVSNWERGVSQPPIKTLKTLGKLYNVDPEKLFEKMLSQTIEDVTRDLKRKFARIK